jgi:hypothetical protein
MCTYTLAFSRRGGRGGGGRIKKRDELCVYMLCRMCTDTIAFSRRGGRGGGARIKKRDEQCVCICCVYVHVFFLLNRRRSRWGRGGREGRVYNVDKGVDHKGVYSIKTHTHTHTTTVTK